MDEPTVAPEITITTTVPNEPAGVPDGTVLTVTNSNGVTTQEKVVNELDDTGNVIGFHKEVING